MSLDSVKHAERKVFRDERGALLHLLKESDAEFKLGIKEVYASKVAPGVTKGWKFHKEMTQQLSVVAGGIEFTVFDEKSGEHRRFELSEAKHGLLTIPPGYWYAFRCTSADEAVIVNCANMQHSPDESMVRPLDAAGMPALN